MFLSSTHALPDTAPQPPASSPTISLLVSLLDVILKFWNNCPALHNAFFYLSNCCSRVRMLFPSPPLFNTNLRHHGFATSTKDVSTRHVSITVAKIRWGMLVLPPSPILQLRIRLSRPATSHSALIFSKRPCCLRTWHITTAQEIPGYPTKAETTLELAESPSCRGFQFREWGPPPAYHGRWGIGTIPKRAWEMDSFHWKLKISFNPDGETSLIALVQSVSDPAFLCVWQMSGSRYTSCRSFPARCREKIVRKFRGKFQETTSPDSTDVVGNSPILRTKRISSVALSTT